MSRTITLLLLAFFACAGPLTAQCPPDIETRLLAAGLPAEQVPDVCPAAKALIGRAVAIEVHGELLDDFTRTPLPLAVSLDADRAVVFNDAVYCGAAGTHVAKLVAVATRDLSRSPLLRSSSCDDDLSAIARRVKPGTPEGWAVAARMTLAWTPWKLTLGVTDAERDGAFPAERWEETRQALLRTEQTTETVAASVPVTPGSLPPIASSSAFYFADQAMTIVIAPTAEVRAIAANTPLPPLRAITGKRSVIDGANAYFVIGHAALNQFAQSFLAQTPIPIQTDHLPPGGRGVPIIGEQNLVGLEVTGGNGRYVVTGQLEERRTPHSRFSAEIRLSTDAGGDLAVEDQGVSITAEPDDCTTAQFGSSRQCTFRNVIRALVASAASAEGSKVLSGKPWIGYLSNKKVEIPLGATVVGLRGNVQRISADAEALVIQSDLRLTKK